ncbi:MAG TPA: hypothetical protein VK158_04850 [Acidobacteriota bacterium]|nr:hypothetical protein [Acidobacteriota bacterium]
MMKQKLSLLIMLVIVLLLFSGCQNAGNHSVDDDYRKGTSALTMRFLPNAPTSQIGEGEPASIGLEIKNLGAANITRGMIRIAFDESVLTIDPTGATQGMPSYTFGDSKIFEGRSATNPKGDSEIILWPVEANPLPLESATRVADIVATACYQYKNIMTSDVCIDVDPYDRLDTGEKKIRQPCELTDLSPATAGGPINVKTVKVAIEQDDSVLKPRFIFTVENMGKGLVYKPGSEQFLCNDRDIPTIDANVVGFWAKLSETELVCDVEDPADYIGRGTYLLHLKQNTARIVCELESFDTEGQIGNFKAPLTVELYYGYVQTESTRTTVIRR